MSAVSDLDTEQLIQSVAQGNDQAREQLLNRHRQRLLSLVTIRMDARLASRVDPSDVVQDSLVVAQQRLNDYVRQPSLAFYPWLRQITLNCMTDLYRHHLKVEKRSIQREHPAGIGINDESALLLANRFAATQSSPSKNLKRAELEQQVMQALQRLPDDQREIIVMRHLEELSIKEIATILSVPMGSVMSRHFRGMKTLRRLLDD